MSISCKTQAVWSVSAFWACFWQWDERCHECASLTWHQKIGSCSTDANKWHVHSNLHCRKSSDHNTFFINSPCDTLAEPSKKLTLSSTVLSLMYKQTDHWNGFAYFLTYYTYQTTEIHHSLFSVCAFHRGNEINVHSNSKSQLHLWQHFNLYYNCNILDNILS